MGPHAAPNEPGSPFPSFVALYDEYVEELYRFVHRRCRDHGLAEDITQDTFMTALRDHDLDEISMAWLKRVARNRLVDVLRRQSNYVTKLRLVGQGSADAAEVDIAERLRVEGALDELSIEHRLVLTLHYIDGLPVAAIAGELDRSSKSIEGLITRARRQLRSRLGESDV